MYVAFLDEFGHIGPFVSRNDKTYNHSPVFGLAGFILPHAEVRSFATWFFQQKNLLLAHDIKKSAKHPATWEKKGTELFTTKNIARYPAIMGTAYRLINRVYRSNGRLFFHGREKYLPPAKANSTGLYTTVLAHSIRQIDSFCGIHNQPFLMILDQHDDRIKLIAAAAKTMFGATPARHLLEPPFQVESHLYQTIQAADWIAALVGRIWAYRLKPSEYGDWKWAEDYFGKRVDVNVTHSSLWRPRSVNPAPAVKVVSPFKTKKRAGP